MRLFRFDAGVGKAIEQYQSAGAMVSRILRREDPPMSVVCVHLGAGGVVGYHRAMKNQLFLVAQGEGWVRGEGPERTAIMAGQASFWEAGEWHESGSGNGMMAIVIEGDGVQPVGVMSVLGGDDGC